MTTRIALLPGDGIGPEVLKAGYEILLEIANERGHVIECREGLVGWAAYDQHQDVMPEETWELCRDCDAILFGAVGLPSRDEEVPPDMRPERRALLALRKQLGLNCNIRPIRVYPGLEDLSPLKKDRLEGGVNLTFFRELTGGEYFGEKQLDPAGNWAEDVCRYEYKQIESIARAAFTFARAKQQKVTSIDKANVLGATGTYWREVVNDIHWLEYPDVELEHVYVDAFNAFLFTRPTQYRVILTSNAYGDILSDGAAGLAGSVGLLPSVSLNLSDGYGLYEPGGGTAPDIAGKGIANPIGMILSVALLFRCTLKDEATAQAIERGVEQALREGYRTADLAQNGGKPHRIESTLDMTNAILNRIEIK